MESPHFPGRQFLQTAAAVFVATTAAMAMAAEPRQRPNIVLLMADEYRHDALGCAGNTVVL
ncbi:MAG TPA: hypothetical protein VMY37_09320 [Thermoguttaceae bacterium]|nr:hypothetical protein [Thermoguttaceae bacterium]